MFRTIGLLNRRIPSHKPSLEQSSVNVFPTFDQALVSAVSLAKDGYFAMVYSDVPSPIVTIHPYAHLGS